MRCEWPVKSFAELIAHGELEIGDGYRAKNDELGGNGLIFLRAGQVTDTNISFAGVDRFHTTDDSRFGAKISRNGDVIITTKGNSTGRVSHATGDMPRFVYSPHLSYWRASPTGSVRQSFLRAWSRGREFANQLDALSRATDMAPYLSLTDQRRLKITVPPIEIQSWLGDLSDAIQARIELLRTTNATLEAIAQALFKSWFVDFDPVHAKAEGRAPAGMDAATAALFPSEFEDSELGPIPKGWQVRSLDAIADYLNGLALQKYPPESNDDFLPVIKIAQLHAGNTRGADKASAHLKPEYVVHDGDVLFSWSGSLEVEVWCGGSGALNQHLFKVTSNKVPKWFYYFATRRYLPQFRGIAANKATTMGHIQRRHLTEAKMAVPPSDVLAALSEFIEPIFNDCVNNALCIRSLEDLRDTLLPRLISGKLRLPEARELVEIDA